MDYSMRYIEAYELIKKQEGKASDYMRGEQLKVKHVIGNSEYGTYYDIKGHVTAGIGHKLTDKELIQYISEPKYKAYWDNLTEEQANEVYHQDFNETVEKALDLTPELHELPMNVATHIISSTFRGSWGLSPEARELFSQCKYKEAAREFLSNDEYYTTPSEGIKTRMETLADAINSLDTGPMCYSQDIQRSLVNEKLKSDDPIYTDIDFSIVFYLVACIICTAALRYITKKDDYNGR